MVSSDTESYALCCHAPYSTARKPEEYLSRRKPRMRSRWESGPA